MSKGSCVCQKDYNVKKWLELSLCQLSLSFKKVPTGRESFQKAARDFFVVVCFLEHFIEYWVLVFHHLGDLRHHVF